jgi:hypothetical protein
MNLKQEPPSAVSQPAAANCLQATPCEPTGRKKSESQNSFTPSSHITIYNKLCVAHYISQSNTYANRFTYAEDLIKRSYNSVFLRVRRLLVNKMLGEYLDLTGRTNETGENCVMWN